MGRASPNALHALWRLPRQLPNVNNRESDAFSPIPLPFFFCSSDALWLSHQHSIPIIYLIKIVKRNPVCVCEENRKSTKKVGHFDGPSDGNGMKSLGNNWNDKEKTTRKIKVFCVFALFFFKSERRTERKISTKSLDPLEDVKRAKEKMSPVAYFFVVKFLFTFCISIEK